MEPTRRREPEGSSGPPSPDESEGQADSVESDQDAVIILGPDRNRSVHPLRRLADEILPYLHELDDRDWTPEELEFIAHYTQLHEKGLRPEKKPGLIRRSHLNERGPF